LLSPDTYFHKSFMAKVFIGIALLFMLVTAGVGFLLKGNVDKLQAKVSSANGKIAKAEGDARAAKNDAEKATKEAKDATDKAAAAEQAAATATKLADDNKKAADELKLVIEGKDKEIAAAKANPAAPTGPDPKIAELTAQLTEATTKADNTAKELAEQKQMNDTLIAKGKDNEQKVADLIKEKNQRALGVAKAGLQGRILAVNAGWNFVVLSVGDKQGVMVNSSLLVVRGNDPIARLRITSVEPSTSIADVLPGTMRRGVSIQPGDTVIFEGSRGVPAAPGAKAPSDPTLASPLPSTAAPLPNN